MAAPQVGSTVAVRSRVLRRFAIAAAVVTLVVLLPWEPLTGGLPDGSVYLPEDRWAVAGTAVVLACVWLVLLMYRVDADADGIRVRGPFRDVRVAWSAVAAVSYNGGSPFSSLQLASGDTVQMVALSRFDGQRAVDDIRALRALHQQAH
ncbi:PH domain-containing protein [Asanoa sp. NPDC049518]|uniref:PH domain-containing protein n=1 Tax=unclassified Asanoa TaxID=2685164 RepID=UPI00342ABCF4